MSQNFRFYLKKVATTKNKISLAIFNGNKD